MDNVAVDCVCYFDDWHHHFQREGEMMNKLHGEKAFAECYLSDSSHQHFQREEGMTNKLHAQKAATECYFGD